MAEHNQMVAIYNFLMVPRDHAKRCTEAHAFAALTQWKGGILGVLLLFLHFWGYLAKFWPVFGTFLLHVKKWPWE